MPILQKKKTQSGEIQIHVNLPGEIRRMLGWEPGDVVLAEANEKTDSVVLRRVEKCNHERSE